MAVKPYEEKTEGSSDSKGKIEVKLHELKSNPGKLLQLLEKLPTGVGFWFSELAAKPLLTRVAADSLALVPSLW